MEAPGDGLHGGSIEVDEDVAAEDEIVPAVERGIPVGGEVQVLEGDALPDPVVEAELGAVAAEVTSREGLVGAAERPGAIPGLARPGEDRPADVGAEDARSPGEPLLLQEDRQRIGLLARGASGAPDVDDVPGVRRALCLPRNAPGG